MDSGRIIWILAPVYNEEAGIKDFIDQTAYFLSSKVNFQFIIVDDGSTDKTYKIAQENLPKNSVILKHEQNSGPGKAFETGIQYFLNHAAENDLLLTIEGDNTADLNTIIVMLDGISSADLILASAYLPGGGFRQTNVWRMTLSSIANKMSRIILGLPFKTLTSFYRLWNHKTLKSLNEVYRPLIESQGFICQVELLYKAKVRGARIIEVPTRVLSDQRKGISKMKLLKTAIEHLKFILISRKFK